MPDTRAVEITMNGVTEEAFYARAEALQPILRQRAAACEAARCVPAETIDELRNADLTRITQPVRYGGHAMGWDVMCGVAQRLCRADGAQGWVQAIIADHSQMLGTFPGKAQEDVWGENPDAVMSASFGPTGIATRTQDGFRLSGQFGFASGIDHADWLICAGFIVTGQTKDGPHFFLVRRSEATVIDDWHTVGLEGTGSKSFEVTDTFVPDHALLDGGLARAGRGPGSIINPQGVFRLPRGYLTPAVFAAMTIGMAQGLLDEWLAYTATRMSRGNSVGDSPSSHIVAGECAAAIEAADALNRITIGEAMAVLDAGNELSELKLLAAKRNSSWACRTTLNAGTKLFNAAGGRAIFRDNPLGRHYRNLIASAAHHIVDWEVSALDSGSAMIGSAG
ncbi:MAG: acyl-CoA dehydrogenase family protein [Pseudomonadota bacterium]|nr:acyl-CoA dehydrogenase family protein [Pseudomonadota bacterium]